MAYTVRFAATSEELDAAYALRRAVFEVEQGIPRPLDRDANDLNAVHAIAVDEAGRCVGTGRAVRVDNRVSQIGRMAVPATHRCQGIGAAILEALERISALRGLSELTVHAQLPAEAFYRNRGFVREGDEFQDQGVPHVLMRKRLPR